MYAIIAPIEAYDFENLATPEENHQTEKNAPPFGALAHVVCYLGFDRLSNAYASMGAIIAFTRTFNSSLSVSHCSCGGPWQARPSPVTYPKVLKNT